MTARDAHNRCVRCGHEWHDRPMGFARHPACPACGSVYWVWQDYEPEPCAASAAAGKAGGS